MRSNLSARLLKLEVKLKPQEAAHIIYVDFEDGDLLVYNDPTRNTITREEYEALQIDDAIELL